MPPRTLHHIALIPDGNRRWARARGLAPEEGHRRGFLEVAPALLDAAWSAGVHTMSLWLFSTENWKRSEAEIGHLMGIYTEMTARLAPICAARRVSVRWMGRDDRVPEALRQALRGLIAETAGHDGGVLNLALDYGGGEEILRALRRMLAAGHDPQQAEEGLLDRFMDTAGQPHPDPDLIVRSSGEIRISGFMPWQSRYAELYFIEEGFPGVTWADLERAIAWYHTRTRRWGR